MSKWIPVPGMILFLGLAYLLDYALDLLRKQAGSTFNPYPLLLGGMIFDFLFLSVLFALAWLVIIKQRGSRLVDIIFILVGLGILLYLPVFIRLFPNYFFIVIRSSILGAIHIALRTTRTQSFFYLASVSLVVIGLASLVLPKVLLDRN